MEALQDFDFSMVPPTWPICFLTGCSLASACLRHKAGEHLPADLTFGPAVYPTALSEDRCRWFKETRVMRGAWGFNTIFSDVKLRDSHTLRLALHDYLGSKGSYYRYHSGERLLSPEQQEWIVALFRSKGYEDHLSFDGYSDVYDFG
ncbi:MAG: hypothetical protein I3J02_06640 [Prevotella sp.]|nr:hypothetical protein [Prevotella sp.]